MTLTYVAYYGFCNVLFPWSARCVLAFLGSVLYYWLTVGLLGTFSSMSLKIVCVLHALIDHDTSLSIIWLAHEHSRDPQSSRTPL